LRNLAADEVASKKNYTVDEALEFIREVGAKFTEMRVHEFPRICEETRRVNFLKKKLHNDIGNSGGWSGDKTFKFQYEIPPELYSFMTNLVYKDFWKEDERKHWQPFMTAIMNGEDPETLLVRTKQIYGSNKDQSLITNC